MSIDDRDDKGSRTSAVQRYASQRQPSPDDDEPENTDPFFKREREVRGPALALTVLLKNGNKKTVPYHLLIEMDYDPETTGIELFFSSGVKITIRGLHLSSLYDDLAEHRILEIRSIDKLHAYNEHRKNEVNGKALPFVEDIVIERGIIDVDSGVWKPAPGTWNSKNQQWQPTGLLN
jgi:hypothetical protein